MSPSSVSFKTFAVTFSVFFRRQSMESTSQNTGIMSTASSSFAFQLPYGGRTYSGMTPVTARIFSPVSQISFLASESGSFVRSLCVIQWTPIRWPSSAICFTRSSFPSMHSPTRKKDARIPRSLRPSRSGFVYLEFGPSSNVSATYFLISVSFSRTMSDSLDMTFLSFRSSCSPDSFSSLFLS